MQESKKQMKHTVTYRDNDKERELYLWVEEKSGVIGPSNTIKQLLYDLMLKEKSNN